jgi:hypothetical protein
MGGSLAWMFGYASTFYIGTICGNFGGNPGQGVRRDYGAAASLAGRQTDDDDPEAG